MDRVRSVPDRLRVGSSNGPPPKHEDPTRRVGAALGPLPPRVCIYIYILQKYIFLYIQLI